MNNNFPKNGSLLEFLRGFATGADVPLIEADEYWAAWSRNLSDAERAAIEALGFGAGMEEGAFFINSEQPDQALGDYRGGAL